MSSYIGKVVAASDRPLQSGASLWKSSRMGTHEQARLLVERVVGQNHEAGIPASGKVVKSARHPEIFVHCGTSPQMIGGICSGCGRKLTAAHAKAFAHAEPRRMRGVGSDDTIMLDNSELTGDHTPISLAAFIELNKDNGSGGFHHSEIAAMRSLRVGESAHLESGAGYTTVVRVALDIRQQWKALSAAQKTAFVEGPANEVLAGWGWSGARREIPRILHLVMNEPAPAGDKGRRDSQRQTVREELLRVAKE